MRPVPDERISHRLLPYREHPVVADKIGALRAIDRRHTRLHNFFETSRCLRDARHLLEGEPAFKLAVEAGIDRCTFHRWQRRFLIFSRRYGGGCV
jgi:hypothetical protein